ncbi:hypothetical protein CEXT_387151 [Caerostris extrusa]|uniref:Uncharacterized protein n=1 Tax=Caerostris extrusa TaxID=172846 RepID=A0AAV4P6N5_CAEEX|nr:hypothetical protein CEXT_387151 [Caerostris extrusa]
MPVDKSVQVAVKPANPAGVESGPVPMLFFNANGAQNSNPEARLRMFLKLMKQLGEMHTAHKTKFDDSKENALNR